jgi:hypothetical protein
MFTRAPYWPRNIGQGRNGITVFHKDAVSVKAAPEYNRGVVVFRPVLGELLLLATPAGLLREALNTADPPARARARLPFRCAHESLAAVGGARQ